MQLYVRLCGFSPKYVLMSSVQHFLVSWIRFLDKLETYLNFDVQVNISHLKLQPQPKNQGLLIVFCHRIATIDCAGILQALMVVDCPPWCKFWFEHLLPNHSFEQRWILKPFLLLNSTFWREFLQKFQIRKKCSGKWHSQGEWVKMDSQIFLLLDPDIDLIGI